MPAVVLAISKGGKRLSYASRRQPGFITGGVIAARHIFTQAPEDFVRYAQSQIRIALEDPRNVCEVLLTLLARRDGFMAAQIFLWRTSSSWPPGAMTPRTGRCSARDTKSA